MPTTPEAPATVDELRVFLQEEEFDALETERAEFLLRLAYVRVVNRLGRESLFNENCKGIQIQMVARVWENPTLVTQSTVGPESSAFGLGSLGLQLSLDEKQDIDRMIRRTGLRTIGTYRGDMAGYSTPGVIVL